MRASWRSRCSARQDDSGSCRLGCRAITDRFDFLRALEELVYDPEVEGRTLERSQLHRILATETSIFGEEHHLLADDESLTNVLRRHLGYLGRDELAAQPVTDADGRTRSSTSCSESRSRNRRTDRASCRRTRSAECEDQPRGGCADPGLRHCCGGDRSSTLSERIGTSRSPPVISLMLFSTRPISEAVLPRWSTIGIVRTSASGPGPGDRLVAHDAVDVQAVGLRADPALHGRTQSRTHAVRQRSRSVGLPSTVSCSGRLATSNCSTRSRTPSGCNRALTRRC